MYHSSATLLPDGSVFVSGSNPNVDYITDTTYPTEYRVETFYPLYFNERRPAPTGLPSTLSYGGSYFNLSLSKDDLFGDINNVKNASVVVIRTGFSTHTMVRSLFSSKCEPGADVSLTIEHGPAICPARFFIHRKQRWECSIARQPGATQSSYPRPRTSM